MQTVMFIVRSRIAFAAMLGIAGTAGAVDPGASVSPPVPADGPNIAAPASDSRPPRVEGLGSPIGSVVLERFRGGEDRTDQDVNIRGQVDGNTANRIVSGTNSVSGDAFGNAAGISTVIQNSGSNVLIQNGMNVYVQFLDPGQ